MTILELAALALSDIRATMKANDEQDSEHPVYVAEVARLNDEARKRLPGGEFIGVIDMIEGQAKPPITAYINRVLYLVGESVQALSDESRAALFQKVADFKDFTKDNDPYGERDQFFIEHEGETYCCKIDYYDSRLKSHSPDKSDPFVTMRAVTVCSSMER